MTAPSEAVSPVSVVFSNSILLRAILQFLPQRDILTCLRVCRDFQYNILHSDDVRRALFLTPLLPANLDIGSGNSRDQKDENGKSHSQTYTLNPLLREIFPRFFSYDSCSHASNFPIAGESSRSGEGRQTRQASATWRKMLVAQPPITELEIVKLVSDTRPPGTESSHSAQRYHCKLGLTMDMLYDIMLVHLTGHNVSFVIDWDDLYIRRYGSEPEKEAQRRLWEIGQVELKGPCLSIGLRRMIMRRQGRLSEDIEEWFEYWRSDDHLGGVLDELNIRPYQGRTETLLSAPFSCRL